MTAKELKAILDRAPDSAAVVLFQDRHTGNLEFATNAQVGKDFLDKRDVVLVVA